MTTTTISSAAADIKAALLEIVEARVDRQMATVHAADVAKLVASGVTASDVAA